jgi:hypothetical protein
MDRGDAIPPGVGSAAPHANTPTRRHADTPGTLKPARRKNCLDESANSDYAAL